MRIVWLAMFVNDEFKHLFDRPDKENWGVWITHLCTLFQGDQDIELHVVAPNMYTNETVSIKRGSITYHFYRYEFDVPRVTSYVSTNPLNLTRVSEEVKTIVRSIEPDLIHVHGCENPLYAAPSLELNKLYPCVFTVQRFNFMASGVTVLHDVVVKLEDMVLRQFKHFGVRTREMQQVISKRNPSGNQWFHNYPVARPERIKSGDPDSEEYDVVFFARITRDKGIFDLIEAARLIIRQRPEYRIRVYGPISSKEEPEIHKAVDEAGLTDVIAFMGNLPDQNLLHKAVSNARLCVLPTHADIVPGTIIESMLMKLPVVTYAVGGTVEFNMDGVVKIILVEKGDTQQLASVQLDLLENPEKRFKMANRAHQFAIEYYSDAKVIADLKRMYRSVVGIDRVS
jgi:glycosyltransferase involved in cell wall biosynthesis